LGNLRVFGCLALVHVPKEKRKKWDPKAKRCAFIGYSTNGYVCHEIKTGKILHSRNVTFDESTFPFKTEKDPEDKLAAWYSDSSSEEENSEPEATESDESDWEDAVDQEEEEDDFEEEASEQGEQSVQFQVNEEMNALSTGRMTRSMARQQQLAT
jgi:hypothetical protein